MCPATPPSTSLTSLRTLIFRMRTNFSCDYQRRFAQWIDRAHPPKRSSATRSFDAWFDSSRGCALREGSAREASGV